MDQDLFVALFHPSDADSASPTEGHLGSFVQVTFALTRQGSQELADAIVHIMGYSVRFFRGRPVVNGLADGERAVAITVRFKERKTPQGTYDLVRGSGTADVTIHKNGKRRVVKDVPFIASAK
jgi:hypothetical protein